MPPSCWRRCPTASMALCLLGLLAGCEWFVGHARVAPKGHSVSQSLETLGGSMVADDGTTFLIVDLSLDAAVVTRPGVSNARDYKPERFTLLLPGGQHVRCSAVSAEQTGWHHTTSVEGGPPPEKGDRVALRVAGVVAPSAVKPPVRIQLDDDEPILVPQE